MHTWMLNTHAHSCMHSQISVGIKRFLEPFDYALTDWDTVAQLSIHICTPPVEMLLFCVKGAVYIKFENVPLSLEKSSSVLFLKAYVKAMVRVFIVFILILWRLSLFVELIALRVGRGSKMTQVLAVRKETQYILWQSLLFFIMSTDSVSRLRSNSLKPPSASS